MKRVALGAGIVCLHVIPEKSCRAPTDSRPLHQETVSSELDARPPSGGSRLLSALDQVALRDLSVAPARN